MGDEASDRRSGPQVKLGSHAVIRHSYEGVVTAAARLYSFATGNAPPNGGVVAEQQALLALDDLVAFAIHARRLIENTIGLKQANRALAPAMFDEKIQWVPITRVINCLIHNRDVDIVRSREEVYQNAYVMKVVRGIEMPPEILSMDRNEPMAPYCIVTSDKGNSYGFGMAMIVETFETKVLEPIIDLCAEDKLFLERLD